MPSPVKQAASDLQLPVTDRAADVLDRGVDVGVVVAYGRLIRVPVLGSIALVNMHFSLLPRWRGAAPVERAILAGDTETGVCLMAIEEGLDTGPVYARRATPIDPGETAAELRDRLATIGVGLLLERLEDPPGSLGVPIPQEGEPSYAPKLDVAELQINWSRPALELHRLVRIGRAFTTWRGQRLIVHRARVVDHAASPGGPPGTLVGAVVLTGEGGLELIEVQPAGRPRLGFEAWANGARPAPGERFGI